MKPALIILFALLAIVMGLNVSSLQKELLIAGKNTALYKKRNDNLQGELMRTTRSCAEKERFLDEIEQSIAELESKVELEALERYIPKKTWSEIKPIIDRLKAFQETRENNKRPKDEEDS